MNLWNPRPPPSTLIKEEHQASMIFLLFSSHDRTVWPRACHVPLQDLWVINLVFSKFSGGCFSGMSCNHNTNYKGQSSHNTGSCWRNVCWKSTQGVQPRWPSRALLADSITTDRLRLTQNRQVRWHVTRVMQFVYYSYCVIWSISDDMLHVLCNFLFLQIWDMIYVVLFFFT